MGLSEAQDVSKRELKSFDVHVGRRLVLMRSSYASNAYELEKPSASSLPGITCQAFRPIMKENEESMQRSQAMRRAFLSIPVRGSLVLDSTDEPDPLGPLI